MINKLKESDFFFIKIISCSIISLITAILYFAFFKSQIKDENLKVICYFDSFSKFQSELYLDYGDGFNEKDKKSQIVKLGDTLVTFHLLEAKDRLLHKIRIDINTKDEILILEKIILSNKKKIFELKGEELYQKIKFISGSSKVVVDNDKLNIFTNKNKDLYITFDNTLNLATPNWLKTILLLIPWVILFGYSILKGFLVNIKNKNYFFILISMFIISLPLKEAWSTLSLCFFGLYGFYNCILKKKLSIQYEQIGVFLFFLILLIFGKIEFYSQIKNQLGLLIIPFFFALSHYRISISNFYSFFCDFFMIIMSILAVSLVISIFINFETTLVYYVQNKKDIIGNVTYWMVYRHPTFLSSFILIGLSLCNSLYLNNKVNLKYYLSYIILSFLTIAFLGSRISLVILFVLLLTSHFNINKSAFFYVIIFVTTSISIYMYIEKIDYNRHLIWSEAIVSSKKHYFGNGLGSSELLFVDSANSFLREKINHPHNQFITYYYELGIVGVIMLFCFCLYYGYLYISRGEKERLSVLFILMMLMITESPFDTTKPLFVFSFFLSYKLIRENQDTA